MRVKITRRQAAKAIALGALGAAQAFERALGQGLAPVRIARLEELKSVWDRLEFRFEAQPCLLVRPPRPEAPDARILIAGDAALRAFSRVCTHGGCTLNLPDPDRVMACPCHASEFGLSGQVLAGPARLDLRALRLELRGDEVWAIGWLE